MLAPGPRIPCSSQSGSAARRRAREALCTDEMLPGTTVARLLAAIRNESDPSFCHNNKCSAFKVPSHPLAPGAL